ncbi:putative dual specificity phosphatase [Diaporthe ampelina]|uniref:Putative dual specificity phosphatase n=1 Tax=Diaporthe ampelina TaxID=1214573 RepID=A0A0G2FB31_9PEZI|nr:putative dual specificity phosphatase [Diaporthe ampelina]
MQSSWAQHPQPRSLSDGVVRTASFTSRPPSPPYIQIPTPLSENNNRPLTLTPSYASVDPRNLTPDDLHIITGGRPQEASDNYKSTWKYEDRRKAQPVLDFLYLGPLAVVRNHEFLRQQGITMLLAVRDASMSHLRLLAVERAAAELNLHSEYVDVASRTQLIHDFPLIIAKINDHLLRMYRSQLQAVNDAGNVAIDTSTFRRGKVLVFCETGNERSAVVVAAYLMAIYGIDMVSTVQFISAQRFCATFDEEMKHLLRSFGDILEAQRMVSRGFLLGGNQQATSAPAVFGGAAVPMPASKKRGIDDTMDEEDLQDDFLMDGDRYEDRAAFMPYRQS